jgi:hypothetical protein
MITAYVYNVIAANYPAFGVRAFGFPDQPISRCSARAAILHAGIGNVKFEPSLPLHARRLRIRALPREPPRTYPGACRGQARRPVSVSSVH